MATIGADSFPKEFNMAGSPMVLVLSGVLSGFPSGSVFRQMEITVSCSRPDTGAKRDFAFLVDADGDEMRVDISSAARSILMDVDYQPSWMDSAEKAMPYVLLSATFRAKYMVDGEIYYGASTTVGEGTRVVSGRISELDRLRVSAHVADYFTKIRFTAKPMDGMELVPLGERVCTVKAGTDGTVTMKSVTTSALGVKTLADGRKIYVTEQDGTMFPLVFVNSMGVLDTATAICSEALSYGIESETFNLTGTPDNKKVYGMEALKGGGRAVLTMSSGYVTRKWADWWAEEVMRTSRCWVKFGKRYNISGNEQVATDFWVPCILTPKDDAVQVYDRSEQKLCYVEFELQVCAEGSLLRCVSE